MREEDVKNERKREQVSWRRTGREPDEEVCQILPQDPSNLSEI